MLDDAQLRILAGRLTAVPGLIAVTLGGSRARGDHTANSDLDLGLYYRGAVDTGALRLLADEVAEGHASITETGEWGPWVDGGGWLSIGGMPVDWIYRDISPVHT
jgi:predicted nucleotidyltransferase